MNISSFSFLSNEILVGLYALSENPQTIILYLIAILIIYLATKHQNTIFFLAFGIGIILANIPFSSAVSPNSWLLQLQNLGLKTQLLPILFLFCTSLKCDFTTLLQNPRLLFFTTFTRLSIFVGIIISAILGFSFTQASSINIIATADLPISIFFVNNNTPDLLGSIVLFYFFYTYFAPKVQSPIINLLTNKQEWQIKTYIADKNTPNINQKTKFLFPVLLIIILGTLIPFSLSLIGVFMLGVIIKESGTVPETLEKNLLNITTILLALTIGSLIKVDDFLKDTTLLILYSTIALLILQAIISTITLKIYNKLFKHKINPIYAKYISQPFILDQQSSDAKNIHSAIQLSNIVVTGLMMALIPALLKLLGV